MNFDKIPFLNSTLKSSDSSSRESLLYAANEVRWAISNDGGVSRNSDHLSLIANGYRHALRGGDDFLDIQESFLELSSELLHKADTSIKRLSTKIAWLTTFGDSVDARGEIQKSLSNEIDPLARLLNDTASMAPVFGPRLEHMLVQMNELIDKRNSFIEAHGAGFDSLIFDSKFLAGMVLNSLTLDAKFMTKEMTIPTDSSSMYPFGWMFNPGFTTHPVVKELGKLVTYLDGVDVDATFREMAMTNLLGCVVNWCGEMALTDIPKSVSTPRSNRQCNAVIFDTIFAPERLEGALAVCNEKGLAVLAEYVLDNHRSLGGKLPRQARAKNLENDMGL